MGELVDGLTDGLTVLGENVDIQLGKDDGSNDGLLDGSIDGLDGFLVLGGKERYITVGHDEVDDTMGLFVDSIVVDEMDNGIVDGTSLLDSNDFSFSAVTIFDDINDL